MSQSNLFMIPIDESILLPMESLDQHMVDSTKPSIISPILRNILLQYGEPAYELLNYSETLPQEIKELPEENSASSEEQIMLSQANVLLPSENIVLPSENIILPLGAPPFNYEMHDVAFSDEKQEIAFIKRSIPEKRTMEKTQIIENGIDKVDQKVKVKSSKRSKMSVDQIAEKIAKSQSEITEPIPSTSTMHDIKTNQDTEPNESTSRKKGKSKKRSKRKEISEDHDKEPKKKKLKKDSLVSNKELKMKKLKKDLLVNDKQLKKKNSNKDSLDKKSDKTKSSEEVKEQKISSREKKKSSKKGKLKELPLQVNESTESLVDIKEKTSSSKRNKSIKRQSSNNLSIREEKSNVSINASAKRPRRSQLDINDPIYLEPFKYGWIREVVYRSTNDKNTKIKKGDTYYYSPEGKKFRTRKEMSETLSNDEMLTEDNFIYLPRPIGINDDTKEIVRDSFTDSVFKTRIFPNKSRTKSQKSSQHENSSQEDTNITLNNSEQTEQNNSDFAESAEDTSISNSHLQEESTLDETNNHETTLEDMANQTSSVNHVDTTVAECDIKIKESNFSERPNETTQLDNDENLPIEETSSQRTSPNAEKLNSEIQSQFNTQNDNESRNMPNEECNFKNENPSFITSNVYRTAENSEIEPFKSIDLGNRLDTEIKSSSFNIIEEVDSNKECQLSDSERNLNEYSDNSNESDYKLELESVPEKNLEELNSSFSEKMFISEALIKKSETAEINGCEEKNSSQKTETENLTNEKELQNNFDYIRSIDSEVEISNNINLDNLSVPKSSSTSTDVMKISILGETTNSLKENETENWIAEETAQSNLGCTENIDSVVEISNNSKSGNELLVENSITSTDTCTVSVPGKKTKSLKEGDIENLVIEETSQRNHGSLESIDSVVEISNNSKSGNEILVENSITSTDTCTVSVPGKKTKSLKEGDIENLVTEETSQRNHGSLESIDSVVEISNNSKSGNELFVENSITSTDTCTVSVPGKKTKSLKEADIENLVTEETSQRNHGSLESIDSVVKISNNSKSDNVSLVETSTISSDIVSGTGEKTKSLEEADTENLFTEKTSQSNHSCTEIIDSVMEISNDLKSDEIYVPESSLNVASEIEIEVDEQRNFQDTGTCDSTTDGSLSNLGHTKSVDSVETNDLKSDEIVVPESSIILSEESETTENLTIGKKAQINLDCIRNIGTNVEISMDLNSDKDSALESSITTSDPNMKMSAIDEKMNSQQKADSVSVAANNSLKSNSEKTRNIDSEIEIPRDLKSDVLELPKSSSFFTIPSEVSVMGEKTNSYKKFDADNLTVNSTLQSNVNQTSSIDTSMEITQIISQTTLSTTLSVTSTDSLTVSSDSATSTNQTSTSEDLSPATLSSSATLSQSSSDAELASSSENVTKEIVSESVISIETSLSSLTSTSATVTESKTISSPETLSIPLHKELVVNEFQTSETESVDMADIKDGFNDDKTSLVGGIKKVDQGLYNYSDSFYSDSTENTYLVNTEGNTFSFTTASFKQSKQFLPNKETSVSEFKDDINCMKTIAESIKTLSLPSDLTNKQYFLSSPDVLTNEISKNKSSNEIKFDNINLNNVNQIPPQEENFDKKPHVSCLKDNISKSDTSDCIQKEKSPSIVISYSKNVWLELDNSNLNENKNLISKINESSDLKKMDIDVNESELSNLSEISGPMCSKTLNVTNREDTVTSTAIKSEYQSTESNSQEFVRSQSYEYQSSSIEEDKENFENLNDLTDNLDDTLSTISGNSIQDNSYEHSKLCESSTMSKYEDYLVSNEFSEIIEELAAKNEPTPDTLGVTKSVELHNDLCEFIKLPSKKVLQNKQLLSSEQKENKSNLMSNVAPVATEEISVQNNYSNVSLNLPDVKSEQKVTCTSKGIRESNFCKLPTLPSQTLFENRESNSYKVADENIYPVLKNMPSTVSKNSIENNYNRDTNVPDLNLQKLDFANQAVGEGRYSFECSPEILVELNNLLKMSDENEHDINQSLNVPASHSTKLNQENSKLQDISNSPLITHCSRKISSMKPVTQSTPLSSLKHESKKIHFQSKLVCPHSMTSFCAAYRALKHIFEYLNFEDLLIAMGVCKVWQDIAQQPHLWKTIRIKNSQMTHNLAKILQNHGTEHLLVVEEDVSDWRIFINVLPEIKSLRIIELCPCPALVFEEIVKNCPQLKIVNALSLKDDSINVESIQNLSDPEKLHLGGVSSMSMEGDLSFLSGFSNLTHLSLRSIKDLGKKNMNVLQCLQELQSLELGECSEVMNNFGSTTLVGLNNLKRLRLEKIEGADCCSDILNSVSVMENLTQLELVNTVISRSFIKYLPKCQNIKKLLIIPMYGRRIAFSNNVIIKSTTRLHNLVRFVWGIPEEFVENSKSFSKRPCDDCISVLKPVPFKNILENIESDKANSTFEMDSSVLKILPLHILNRLYAHVLPDTQTDILKIPAFASWNLSIT